VSDSRSGLAILINLHAASDGWARPQRTRQRTGTSTDSSVTRDVDKYFSRRACLRPTSGPFDRQHPYDNVVVIPALAESESLPATLTSLETNDALLLKRTLILVVINNPQPADTAPEADRARSRRHFADNQATLQWLAAASMSTTLQLAWIDASSPGFELPADTGVGLARRIGCDTALRTVLDARTDGDLSDVVLLNLDADTLVQPDYLTAADELRRKGVPGGVVRFRHQAAETAAGQDAIDAYELYLHYYVLGLKWSNSPYAFHTIGSTILCRALDYIRAGGMPMKRLAGEDFYFLQQLAKVGGVSQLDATTVVPSPRASRRVPFGTGPRMAQAMEDGETRFEAHHPDTFGAVRTVLRSVRSNTNATAEQILGSIDIPEAVRFLEDCGFIRVFPKLQQQHGHGARCVDAFHLWFDGLRTFRLITHLAANGCPKQELLTAWSGLHRMMGVKCRGDTARELLQEHLSRCGWTDGGQDPCAAASAKAETERPRRT